MENNLFYYATSELSQDAFICWLLSFAYKNCDKNPALTECAKDMLRLFIKDLEKEDEIYLSEYPQKQYKNIDILLTVNDKYKVIVEDKTFSEEHDNQLIRYKNIVKEDFPEFQDNTIGVYFKTGFQSNLENVKEAKYVICDRKNILEILERHRNGIKNDIFHDYYTNLKNFNDAMLSFKSKPISDWEWREINGFFEYFQDEANKTNCFVKYGYIHNQTGGFYGMWIYNGTYQTRKNNKYELYLQCQFENKSLKTCFRVSCHNGKIDRSIRESMIWKEHQGKWTNIMERHDFIKPQRYGVGRTVSLGEYRYQPRDYKDAVEMIHIAVKSFEEVIKELNID